MRILKFVKKLIRSLDLFGQKEFFRYNSQQTFQSLFGGFVSILIIIGIGIIFYNRFLQCVNKVNISSTETKIIQADPPILDVSTYPKGKFMAAISVEDIDLTDSNKRFFTGYVSYVQTDDGETKTAFLEPCTDEHWKGVPEIEEDLKMVNISRMFCLPLNFSFHLQGKSSMNYKSVNINLRDINNCSFDGSFLPRCPSRDDYFDYFGENLDIQHKLQLYFTNYQIVPFKQNHIDAFLDDRYFGFFTWKIGTYVGLYSQDFTVKTDNGILFQDIVVQTGGLIDEDIVSFQYAIVKRFGQFQLDKSLTSKIYQRSYQKIYNVFSMIGGLFGILCSSLFFIKFYNNSACSVSLGSKVFKSNQLQELNIFKKYNILSYLKQVTHNIFKKVGIHMQWRATNEYTSCEKQVVNYVDVSYIIQRLMFLESSISVVLQKHQQIGLHLRQKLTLDQAYKLREYSNFKNKVDKLIQSKIIQRNTSGSNPKRRGIMKIQQGLSFNFGLQRKSTDEESCVSLPAVIQEQSAFEVFASKLLQQNHDEATQQSQDDKRYSNLASQDQILKDLAKIQQQAKRDKRISKQIVKLSGLSLSGLLESQNKQKKDNTYRQYISPTFLKNTDDINFAQFHSRLQKNRLRKPGQSTRQKANSRSRLAMLKSKTINLVKKTIKKCDVFYGNKFFSYRSQSEHKTLFGGFISALIFASLITIFYQRMLDCIDKTNIYSVQTKKFSSDPTYLKIQTFPKGNFMASIQILYQDLNAPDYRIFDFSLINRIVTVNETTGERKQEIKSFSLEKCTLEHWGNVPELIQSIKNVPYKTLLCFPMGITLQIQGRKSSDEFRTIQILIQDCKDQTDPSRPCNEDEILNFFYRNPFKNLQLRFSNIVLNSKNLNYAQKYLEQRTLLFFSINMMSFATVYLDDYTVITDESIFPWTDSKTQIGNMMTQLPVISSNYDLNNTDGYIRIQILKSPNLVVYERSFEKIQNIFAFVGGIFGILLVSLFLVKTYNIAAYEMALCSKLFKPQENFGDILSNYNFLNFIAQSFYNLLKSMGFSPEWQTIIQLNEFQQEIKKQLDVIFILKRLDFLQCSVSTILESHQVVCLRLLQKPNITQVKEKRKAFELKKKLHKMLSSHKKQNIQSQSSTTKKYLTSNFQLQDTDFVKETQTIEDIIPATIPQQRNQVLSSIQTLGDEKTIQKTESQKQQFSSDSEQQDPNESKDNKQHDQIIEAIIKLQKQAKRSERISQKIMSLTCKTVAVLLYQNLGIFQSINQEPIVRKQYKSRSIFNVTEMNDEQSIDGEEFDPTIPNQNQPPNSNQQTQKNPGL